MAHFAKLDIEGNVLEVLVVANEKLLDPEGNEQEVLGQTFLFNLTGHRIWKQTSFNGNFRKNYAGIGYKYDQNRDAFISPRPDENHTLNEQTCRWELQDQ
jgi:hypothetical protein